MFDDEILISQINSEIFISLDLIVFTVKTVVFATLFFFFYSKSEKVSFHPFSLVQFFLVSRDRVTGNSVLVFLIKNDGIN